ncbi:unnamed protein product [Boreogadus saida]
MMDPMANHGLDELTGEAGVPPMRLSQTRRPGKRVGASVAGARNVHSEGAPPLFVKTRPSHSILPLPQEPGASGLIYGPQTELAGRGDSGTWTPSPVTSVGRQPGRSASLSWP